MIEIDSVVECGSALASMPIRKWIRIQEAKPMLIHADLDPDPGQKSKIFT
jgi:hypothetical protein